MVLKVGTPREKGESENNPGPGFALGASLWTALLRLEKDILLLLKHYFKWVTQNRISGLAGRVAPLGTGEPSCALCNTAVFHYHENVKLSGVPCWFPCPLRVVDPMVQAEQPVSFS